MPDDSPELRVEGETFEERMSRFGVPKESEARKILLEAFLKESHHAAAAEESPEVRVGGETFEERMCRFAIPKESPARKFLFEEFQQAAAKETKREAIGMALWNQFPPAEPKEISDDESVIDLDKDESVVDKDESEVECENEDWVTDDEFS